MSNTIELLDRYRSPVISNHASFTLLALLFRNGSATSNELATELGESPVEIAKLLKELYESDWIRVASAYRLFLTRKSEALLNALDLFPIVSQSLTREVLGEMWLDDYSYSPIAKEDTSFGRQNGYRRSLQIAYWAAKSFPDAESTILKRVLSSVLCALDWQVPEFISRIDQAASYEPDLSWGSHQGDDNRNLRFFFAESKLPNNETDRDVTTRAAFQILVQVISFDRDFQLFRNSLAHRHFATARMWSELESNDTQINKYFSAVASHFRPDVSPSMKRADVLQLISTLCDRVSPSETTRRTSEQGSESSIRKLLTGEGDRPK